MLALEQAGLAVEYRERFSKTRATVNGGGTGTDTCALTNAFPLDQSLVMPMGASGVWAEYIDWGMYLSAPQVVSLNWQGGVNGGQTCGCVGEAIKLASKPKSIEVVAGGSSQVSLAKALSDYTKAFVFFTTQHDGLPGVLGYFAKLISNNQLNFYRYDGTTLAAPPAWWRYHVIQP